MRFAVQQTQQQRPGLVMARHMKEAMRRSVCDGHSPSVLVPKRERVAATGPIDQVAGYVQPNDVDLPVTELLARSGVVMDHDL